MGEIEILTKDINHNTMEYYVKDENEQTFKAGTVTIYNYNEINVAEYTAFPTGDINTFHMRDDNLESFIRKLKPNQKVIMRAGDMIGWGRLNPTISSKFVPSHSDENIN